MKRFKWVAIITLILALAGGGGYLAFFAGADASATDAIYAPVSEGPLVISINESGSIKPRQQLIIKSEVEGRSTILYLVPEGTRVEKGQVLVELDTASLEERRLELDILVQNADAAFISAKENLEIVENQAKSDVELAELNLRFAEEDLEKYKEGEYPNKLNAAIGSVTLAEEELERARDKYEWSQKLYEENYLSETELRSDELSWKRSELNLKTAEGNLDLLKRYTYKRDLAKLESDVRQNTMALERTRRRATSNLVQAQVNLRAKELEFNRHRERFEKILEQIDKARIVAPQEGLVIYATSAQNRWGNQEPLDEGQEVRERQELIYLPTADTFIAEVDIHESNLKKVYPGLPVRIRADAVPGRTFVGTVSRISPLPDPQRMWANPDLKVYKTQINIDGGGDALKSGMNCQAEIIVEQHERTLYIPVQSVTRVDKKPSVWVRNPSGPDLLRHVEIGLDNNRFVRVLEGLSAGEEVLLTPPLAGSVSMLATEILSDVTIPSREEADARSEADRLSTLERSEEVGRRPGRRRPEGAVANTEGDGAAAGSVEPPRAN